MSRADDGKSGLPTGEQQAAAEAAKMQEVELEKLMAGLQQQGPAGDGDEDPGEDPFGPEVGVGEKDVEYWASVYKEMQERMERAMSNTDYPFEPSNPFADAEKPFEEGMEKRRHGSLAEAALAFEVACQRDKENAEAWHMLGVTQAENEKDPLAIIALNSARDRNPKEVSVYSALAVSHANERNADAAMECLKQYLVYHEDYVEISKMSVPLPVEDPEKDDEFATVDVIRFHEVETLYKAAMEKSPGDVNLSTNLGVLYCIKRDFESAAVNFRRAVELTPTDAKLWNKLGAVLANSSHPEEALAAYNRALDINPGYVRAMYNMGVAYNNLGKYMQSAKQIVRALVAQQGSTDASNSEANFMATHGMWELLCMTVELLERDDLTEIAYNQDLPALVKALELDGEAAAQAEAAPTS